MLAVALALVLAAAPSGDGVVALEAGTILPVSGPAITGGGTVLVEGKKIVAVGSNVDVPAGARVVDYGPDAVLVPGLVSANSGFGLGSASPRTAAPSIRAIDNVDFHSSANLYALSGGVTTVYCPPARGRLIAGRGAVIKLAGESPEARTLSEAAAIQGAISAEARSTPGFWEPPIPATVDVGMGAALQQLPRTTMGAIVALTELLTAARGGADEGLYGPTAARELSALMQEGLCWRIDARTEAEVRSIVRFCSAEDLPLVIENGYAAGDYASEIAAAGARVVIEVEFTPSASGRDTGRGRDAHQPVFDTAAKLAAAGVEFAIAPWDGVSARELRFVAGLASRGGLQDEVALRAITLDAAEILGVSERVGSLSPGKDADVCVLTGPPLDPRSSVLATWVDGQVAWESEAAAGGPVVISAEALYIGDGEVLRPGEVLLEQGRIAAVGESVGRPPGVRVVRGRAAMPGMIDALGYLGLGSSKKAPSPDFRLARIASPGDETDRRVARAGVTTVVLSPRGSNSNGTPMMAYKPAAQDLERQIVGDPAAIALEWTRANRLESGKHVTELMHKAAEYDRKWREYEEAIAKWTPPAEEESGSAAEEPDQGGSGDEKAAEEGGEDKDKKSSKKKKKEEYRYDEEDFVGVWSGTLAEADLRLAVWRGEHVDWRGQLSCPALSDEAVRLEGELAEDRDLVLSGVGSRGWVDLEVELKSADELELELGRDDDARAAVTEEGGPDESGKAGGEEAGDDEDEAGDDADDGDEIVLERVSREVPMGRRPERRKSKTEPRREPKGKPKPPGTDEKLEPLRRALHGEVAIVVHVEREDEILACVDLFESLGVRPVLRGASDAWRVADRIAGRVAGVLLDARVTTTEPRGGLDSEHNRYAELDQAGIPVAFHSSAQEGARDLPLMAAYAVSRGMSADGALRALTAGAADMMSIGDRVGRLARGLDADVLLLDGEPLDPATSVLRAWVAGREVR